jgi:hypothetical protein
MAADKRERAKEKHECGDECIGLEGASRGVDAGEASDAQDGAHRRNTVGKIVRRKELTIASRVV